MFCLTKIYWFPVFLVEICSSFFLFIEQCTQCEIARAKHPVSIPCTYSLYLDVLTDYLEIRFQSSQNSKKKRVVQAEF